MSSEAERDRWWNSTAAKVGAAFVVCLLVVGVGGLRWWLTYEAPPAIVDGGISSDDMEGLRISTPLESGTIFRCTPGTLEMWVGFVASNASIELVDVSVPVLDDVWAEVGWAERTGTQVMRDPHGALDDLEDFTGRRLSPGDGWARMKLTWDIAECTQMDGILRVDHVEVTYRAVGRTHHAQVPMPMPLRLTTQSIEDLTEQVTVDRVGASQSGGSST